MKRSFLIIVSLLMSLTLWSQDINSFRSKEMTGSADTIRIDSLIISPGSVILLDESGEAVPDNLYRIDHANSLLILDQSLYNKPFTLQYRVFAYDFLKPYYHKDPGMITEKVRQSADPFRISAEDLNIDSYYSSSRLNSSGSISRGITLGNSQDVVVNSNLNLQLNGKLSDNLNIVAAISDNNIPIQPDGYSQKISEFDKVYIEVFNEKINLVAGDFDLQGSPGRMMDFYKRAAGAKFRGNFDIGKNDRTRLISTVSGAISKGKFCKNSFMGIEGNQGPYKLKGCNLEQYIVILAGTEKVYIDGRLMQRGIERDYTIDYNNAEVTFTPAVAITKDRRIIVEFEYSEQSYARFLIYNSNEFLSGRGNLFFNVYSEQDDKNQSLQQDLSQEEKQLLSGIGDNILRAVTPSIDSVGFNSSEVLYRKTDSIVNSVAYGNVYVWSVNPDLAVYRLRFSNVGKGNGDYIQINTAANGRVFQWLAPVNGQSQGDHEPVILLITPKKKQVVNMGGTQALSDRTRAQFELAFTNNDINTFSNLDKENDKGFAISTGLDHDLLRRDTSLVNFRTRVSYRYVSRYFDPVERFRSVEFERDWNLLTSSGLNDEHLAGINLSFFEHKLGSAATHSEYLDRGSDFRGIRNNINGNLQAGGFELDLYGSLMNSENIINSTSFLRHAVSLKKHLRYLSIGVREEGEDNRWNMLQTDSLLSNSQRFQQYEVFLSRPDTFLNQYFISYRYRIDDLTSGGQFKQATLGRDLSLGMALNKNPNNRLKSVLTYRQLSVTDSLLSPNRPENNLVGRIEHNLQLAKGAVSTSTFYEIGTGLENRQEYSYLEVSPGQGVYRWTDYNNNGVKELDEFEVALFPDEARFIRINVPTSDYISVYTNQFNQIINLNPARVWMQKEGIRKTLSWFSNQFAYRLNRKNTNPDLAKNANPFNTNLDDPDLLTIATSIRNNLSFNKSGKQFGADYIFIRNLNRNLLSNGFETRRLLSHGLRGRYTFDENVSLLNQLDLGEKSFESEFFTNKNYLINFLSNKLSLQYQPGLAFRLVLEYIYGQQSNQEGAQESGEHTIGAEARYSILNKGIVSAKINYIRLSYNENPNTPIAYEMLQGLLPGNNGTWTVLFRRSLTSGIELNMEYSGRVSEEQKVIHTGSLQVRANF